MANKYFRPALLTLMLILCTFVCTTLNAQTKAYKVSGTVADDSDEPLAGVFITIKGTKTGASTDLDGKFTINIASGGKQTLVFQYLGMKEQDVQVSGEQVLSIQMKSDNTLEEAVISAGYGLAQKRSDMTGSAFQVESKQLSTLPAARVDNLLSGMVPGLNIDENSTYSVRSRYNIRVRGDASLSASSEPLWIVDGVPIFTGDKNGNITGTSFNISPLSFINPDDIESITVLKDAATTSIYGADGANGVILVTTKQSSGDGQLHVAASMKYGISKVDRSTLARYCNAEQWWQLAKESWTNSGFLMENFPYRDNPMNSYSTTDTDWYDVYLGTGDNREATLTIDSGTANAKNYLSLSYYGENYTTKGNDQKRIALRDRVNYKFGKKLSADMNIALTYNLNNITSISNSYFRVIPIFSPYDEDGVTPRLYNWFSTETDSYEPTQRKFVYSSVADREFADNIQRSLTADGNATLTYQVIDGLTVTSMFGVNMMNTLELIYHPKTTLDGITSYEQDGHSRRSGVFNFTWNNIDRINFNRRFGKHTVGALAGVELVNKENRSLYATGSGFANDHIKEITYAISESVKGSSSASNSRSLSYLGQVSYSFDNRYYLSASYRRQGNSSFSTYARWGDFSSIGLSWNAHNEHFFNVPWIDRLKVKASYGNSGNSRLDSSAAYGTYSYTSGFYYGGLMGAQQGTPPNTGLSWETTYIGNVGLDISIFDSRIDLQLEAYRKYTKDLLYSGRVSSIITDGSVMRNVGEIENKGLEISLSTRNITGKDFSWTTDFNGAVNRNTIKKLYNGMHTGFFQTVWMEGANKNAWWLSRWAGVDPVDGSPMWYDYDGNLTHTFSYNNRLILPDYSSEPDFRGGMRNTFRYKDFSLVVFLNYTIGGWDLCGHVETQDGYDIISFNALVEELDHWNKPGDVSAYPKPYYKKSTSSTMYSTRFLHSTTNVQVKNVALSYNIPSAFCKKMKLRSASISLIGDNLYFWSPEQSRTGNSYKTLRYSGGITRSFSGQLILNF